MDRTSFDFLGAPPTVFATRGAAASEVATVVAAAEAESDTHNHVQNRPNSHLQTRPAQVRVGKESAAHCVLAVQYAACSSVLARSWRP